jgi:serine-type D-Ala-D-Ala carboxypeptidase/endopeptidase (penicillin-binding protein 4)
VPEGDGDHVESPPSPAPRPSGRLLRRCTAGLVVLVLVLAGATYWFALGARWFGFDYPSPVTQPAEVPPPPGLTLPGATAAGDVAVPTPEQAVDRAAVRRALRKLVRSPKLGRVTVQVAQLSDGHEVYTHGPSRVAPASTMKLLTTTAAMGSLGADHRFTTTVVARRTSDQIVLVGGGDPLLARKADPSGGAYPSRANLGTLAKATVQALRNSGRTKVRLRYDTSLFSGPAVSPKWPPSYIPDDVVSPISPLWVDEGRDRSGYASRSTDPAAAAAEDFRKELAKRKIRVVGKVLPKVAPDDAQELASVQSAPLAQIVQEILEVSDNEGAEVLARQVAVKEGEPGSFAGGARAVRRVLGGIGIDMSGDRLFDGSGLSRLDRLRAATLMAVLETDSSRSHPDLRPVVANLPVAGFTGSLTDRFATGNSAGLGRVRAKTGTLTGVQALAGTVSSVDGAVLAFVAVANKVKVRNTLDARAKLDDMAAALAGCTCARSSSSASPTP